MSCLHRPSKILWVFAFALGTLSVGASAHASTKSPRSGDSTALTLAANDISPDDSPQAKAVTTPGKPSPEFATALLQFNARHWADAAIGWHAVALGETSDDPGNRQLAEYYRAVCLFHLELDQSSFSHFAAIAENRQHLRFADTLPWLSQLIERLPEPARVSAELLRFNDTDIAESKLPGSPDARSTLWYWRGRELYEKRELDKALANLRQIGAESGHFVEAQFFIAAASVLKRESLPAVAAMQRVLSVLDEHRSKASQPARVRDLATLTLARILYSSAIRLNRETNVPTIDGEHLNSALTHWRKIPPESEYWLESQHEMAWAYFMAGAYGRALGAVHAIQSPYFDEAAFPEVSMLKAVIYFANCNYDAAMVVHARFEVRFEPMRVEIERLLKQYKTRSPDDFYAFLLGLKSDQIGLMPEAQPVATSIFRERSFVRRLEYVTLLDRERQRLNRLPQSLQASSLGKALEAALARYRKLAIREVAMAAAARYQRFVDDVLEQRRNGEKILIDITAASRNPLDSKVLSGPLSKASSSQSLVASSLGARTDALAPPKGHSGSHRELLNRPALPPRWYEAPKPGGAAGLDIDGDHIVWPFDGEYWRDELGTYQQVIMSTCGGGWRGRRNLL